MGNAICREQFTVNDPRLTSKLGRAPAELNSKQRGCPTDHHQVERPFALFNVQLAESDQQREDKRKRGNTEKKQHHVVALINQVDIGRALVFGEIVDARELRIEVARCQEARKAGDFNSDELLVFLVNPTDERHAHGAGLVLSFHGGQFRWLLLRHLNGLLMRSRNHKDRARQRNNSTNLDKLHARIAWALLEQEIRAHCNGHKRAAEHHGNQHVRIALQRGIIERGSEKVRKHGVAIGTNRVTCRSLHPRVRDNNP